MFGSIISLTLLPALLGLIGGRIESLRVVGRRQDSGAANNEHGFWAALSYKVMRRPVVVLVPTFLFLLLLGAPFRQPAPEEDDLLRDAYLWQKICLVDFETSNSAINFTQCM